MPFERTIHTDIRQEAIQRAKNYLAEFGFSPFLGPRVLNKPISRPIFSPNTTSQPKLPSPSSTT